jgi:propanol-preferring alcohol dehydrogenase
MVLAAPGRPLEARDLPDPQAADGAALVRVRACGVCRTDLHLADGELDAPRLPVVLGHQIVGEVIEDAGGLAAGTRVGIPWLGWTCGRCRFCTSQRENLCPYARFTGRDIDGGFAELTVADPRFCFALPDAYPDLQAAPLLCAGLIGARALRLATEGIPGGGEESRLGLYGFGASAHIVCQVARARGVRVFAFTRPGDTEGQRFARELGAEWAGGAGEGAPEKLDAAIIFASAGELVPEALRATDPGGTVVCAGIHMSDIPSFPYADLWGERVLRSVANLTRRDGLEFLAEAPRVPVHTAVTAYALEDADRALDDLRSGRLRGAAVLGVAPS